MKSIWHRVFGDESAGAEWSSNRSFGFEDIPPTCHDDDIWIATCRFPYKHDVLDHEALLVYQPDVRLYCTKGHRCKHVKEIDAHKEESAKRDRAIEHMIKFTHVSGKLMKEAQLQRIFCSPLNKYRWTIGGSVCWAITDQTSQVPDQLAERSVVIYVHGFRQHCNRIMNVCKSLKSYFVENATCQEHGLRKPLVIGFFWPSMSKAIQYMAAREMAKAASVHLSRLIRALQSRGCDISILAHSLGARVSLQALLDQEHCFCINHLILLSPAVPSDSFAEEKRFPRSRLATKNIHVCWSKHDQVLNVVYGIGERAFDVLHWHLVKSEEAMGSHGPQGDVCNCSSLDFSDAVTKHSVGDWMNVPALVELLCELLLRQPREDSGKSIEALLDLHRSDQSNLQLDTFSTDSESEDSATMTVNGSALQVATRSPTQFLGPRDCGCVAFVSTKR